MRRVCQTQTHKIFRGSLFGLLLNLFLISVVRGQFSFKLELDTDQVTYRVYLISSVSYNRPQSIIASSFITIHVPHGTGANQFVPTNLTSSALNMRWTLTGRSNAPRENPDRDYLYFSFANGVPNFIQFDIVAGQPYLLFTFKRQGPCLGAVQLIDNATDEFRTPNSHNTNVANYIAVLGGGRYSSNADVLPTISVTASKTAVCAGETIQIQATPSVPVASPGTTYIYQLLVDGQAVGPASAAPVFTYKLPQRTSEYTTRLRVKLLVKRTTACEEEFAAAAVPVQVKVLPSAQINYSGDPCAVLPVSLSANRVAGATYQWLHNGQLVSGETSPVLAVSASGSYAVGLTLNSCTAVSVNQLISGQTQAEQVTVQIPSMKPVVSGTPVLLVPRLSHVQSVSWSPETGLSSATILTPTATPTETTTYTLTVWSRTGCSVSDTVTVRIIPALYIPNAFTPNNDGVNDTWVIQNTHEHLNCTVNIYDRWGILIFHSERYNQPWNGQVRGAVIEPGMYVYTIQTPYAYYKGRLVLLH